MRFSRQEYWSGVPLPSPRDKVLGWPKSLLGLFRNSQCIGQPNISKCLFYLQRVRQSGEDFFPPLFLTLQHYISFPGLTRKLIVSQVWDPEVQNQGVSRFIPSDGWQERLCSGPLSLAYRQLSSLCACLCPSFPSSQGH